MLRVFDEGWPQSGALVSESAAGSSVGLMTKHINDMIADQHRRLDELEGFVLTPDYERPLTAANVAGADEEL